MLTSSVHLSIRVTSGLVARSAQGAHQTLAEASRLHARVSPRCLHHYHGSKNAPSTRFKNLVESNSVLFTITTAAMFFVG